MTTHVAFLRHTESDIYVALAADGHAAAEARARAWILGYTADFRDFDEYPDNDAWIDVCLGEGWEIDTAEIE